MRKAAGFCLDHQEADQSSYLLAFVSGSQGRTFDDESLNIDHIKNASSQKLYQSLILNTSQTHRLFYGPRRQRSF